MHIEALKNGYVRASYFEVTDEELRVTDSGGLLHSSQSVCKSRDFVVLGPCIHERISHGVGVGQLDQVIAKSGMPLMCLGPARLADVIADEYQSAEAFELWDRATRAARAAKGMQVAS